MSKRIGRFENSGASERSGKMLRRMMLAVLLGGLIASSASAGPSLVYDGSFRMPNSSAWGDYYYRMLTFVPANTPRPGQSALSEPTLIGRTTWSGGKTREANGLPAPSLTAGGMGTATLLLNASGGTAYDGGATPSCVDSAGNLWDGGQAYSSGPGFYSDPLPSGTHLLGGTASAGTIQESGWYAGPGGTNYGSGGVLRRGDGLGGAYPTDGTTIGAHFVTTANLSATPSTVYVADHVRTSATTVSGSLLFSYQAANYTAGKTPIQYVKDTGGNEYFVTWLPGAHTGDSFLLDFYDSNTTGSGVSPTVSLDIGPGIVAGAGWLISTSQISYVTVDWDASQLYVLDAGTSSGLGQDALVHVFTLDFVEPPVAEPAGLGLVGLLALSLPKRALLGLKRRRS